MGHEFDYDSQPIEYTHMGQFLQGGNFGCFLSLFLKVERLCDET